MLNVFKGHNACGGRELSWMTYAVNSCLMFYVPIQFIQEITWSKSVMTYMWSFLTNTIRGTVNTAKEAFYSRQESKKLRWVISYIIFNSEGCYCLAKTWT